MTRSTRSTIGLVGAILLVAILGIGVGYLAGRNNETSAPTAAAAPVATVEVQQRRLSEQVTLTCTVRQPVASLPVVESDTPQIVTAWLSGMVLRAGRPLAEVSGRPVFPLQGSFPLYRDLTVGDRGPDVKELQRGLDDAGYPAGADGVFGVQTANSLRRMYQAHGYTVPTVTPAATSTPTPSSSAAVSDGSGPNAAAPAAAPQPTVAALRLEIRIIPVLPAKITGNHPKVGQTLTTKLADFAAGLRTATCVSDSDADIPSGTKVLGADNKLYGLISGPASVTVEGQRRSGWAVSSLAATAASGEQDGLTAVLQSSKTTALVVPYVAVGGSGDASQVVVEDQGTLRPVIVTVGLEAGGYCVVEPLDPSELKAGDHVVVPSS